MVTKVKAPVKLAPARPATTWPYPTPGVEKKKAAPKKISKPAIARGTTTDNKKHAVMASLNNVELAKAKSALTLDLYANDKIIGHLEVGQGSFFWKGAGKQKSKPIDWTRFAAMMNKFAYEK